jgi:Asp-tRNA(Asn)/Glu-tRNA(Gln) amidotransferase A subunit family amidase
MRPAAFCGVVGFKPSHAWIHWRQARDYAPTFDVVGGLARSVQDIILLMRGITGKRSFDPQATLEKSLRVGVYRTPDWQKVTAAVQRMYEETVVYLSRSSCDVREVRLPKRYENLTEVEDVIFTYESSRSFEWELKQRRENLEPGLIELLEKGWAISRERYLTAVDVAEECRARFTEDLGDVDLLMVPGAAMEAPKSDYVGSNDCISMWMPLHVPDVALPVGHSSAGLPIGVQLIGRRGDDVRHLLAAKRIEDLLSRRV